MCTDNDKPKLNDEKVLRQAKKTLEMYLPLEADGYCVTSETLYDILIVIAANRGTTESVCAASAHILIPYTQVKTDLIDRERESERMSHFYRHAVS